MVAGGLGLMLLGILVQILIPLSRNTGRAATRAELLSSAVSCLSHLEQDIKMTVMQGFYQSSGAQVNLTSFQPVGDPLPTGLQAWANEVHVFRWQKDQGLLFYDVCLLGATYNTSLVKEMSPSILLTLVNARSGTRQLARCVNDLVIQTSAAGSPLHVEISLKTDSAPPEAVSLKRDILIGAASSRPSEFPK